MASPLETRLVARIAQATEESARGIHVAELACYWARTGDFERAESSRVELRKVFGDGRDLRVSVLIMILEALLLYFKDLSPAAKDRLVRAKLLCAAGKESRLLGLTSAWLAHIQFNLGQFEDMAASIATSLDSLEADDGTAECRLSLVLGDAFMYSSQEAVARNWYERARVTATQLGDQAAIGAMTYNRAALRVANLRVTQLAKHGQSVDFSLAKAEVKSATNYQAVAGLRSLDHLLKEAQIGILMLEQDFQNALPEIERVLDSGQVPRHSGAFFTLRADRIACLTRIGAIDSAQQFAGEFKEVNLEALSPDDRALCLASLEALASISESRRTTSDISIQVQDALADLGTLRRKLHASLLKYA